MESRTDLNHQQQQQKKKNKSSQRRKHAYIGSKNHINRKNVNKMSDHHNNWYKALGEISQVLRFFLSKEKK